MSLLSMLFILSVFTALFSLFLCMQTSRLIMATIKEEPKAISRPLEQKTPKLKYTFSVIHLRIPVNDQMLKSYSRN